MIKVLQVHGGMNVGGTESVLMNWYRNIDRKKIQFDFTTTFEDECPYDKEIKLLGGNIKYIIPVSKGGYFKHCYSLYKVIKEGNYNVVHSHMNFHGGVVAIISRLCGVKKIICHSHSAQGVRNKNLKNTILKLGINIFATKKIACGQEAGNYVFGKKSKFVILNNAIDFRKINNVNTKIKEEIINKYNLKTKRVILQIGRMDENKNHKFTINMIKKIENKKNIKVFFIGDGELRKEIQQLVDENNLENVIECVGIQNNIREWLTISDLIILPSKQEGVPMCIIEAQSLGKKCIVSKSVSNEVDLGLNLIEFFNIEDELCMLEWINYLKTKEEKNVLKKEFIKSKLRKKEFLIEDIIKNLQNIYFER